ncbi:MAG TPA: hypothetical protein DDY20_05540 [Desulfobulbaceae bacterium]|nr:hypothetical protein [Desulfobulbaceae bacterium]
MKPLFGMLTWFALASLLVAFSLPSWASAPPTDAARGLVRIKARHQLQDRQAGSPVHHLGRRGRTGPGQILDKGDFVFALAGKDAGETAGAETAADLPGQFRKQAAMTATETDQLVQVIGVVENIKPILALSDGDPGREEGEA